MIDTKQIRFKLMSDRKLEKINPNDHSDQYYNGVLDALLEVEKIQNPEGTND